jgi:PAS domain S-box-containing protein
MDLVMPFGETVDDDSEYGDLSASIAGYAVHLSDASGVILSWSASARRLKGYEAAEVVGQHFSIFYTEEDRRNGVPHAALEISKSRGSFRSEGWRVRKDGSRFWGCTAISSVKDTTSDLVTITLDLTPRKRAADALRRSDEQISRFIQSTTDCAVFLLDVKGRVESWSIPAAKMMGFRSNEMIGQSFGMLYTPDAQSNGAAPRMLDVASRRGRFEGEGWRVRGNGERFWAHVVIDAVRDQTGVLTGFVKSVRDLTVVRKAAVAAEASRVGSLQSQKMETMGRLTVGVAHDFANLLMVVLGGLEIVQRRLPPDPTFSPLLENAVQAAHRGRLLTQRLLGFARRQELRPEAINLAALVRGMFDLFQRTLGVLVTLETNLPADLPDVFADPNQLELAILNLATNARDAMPDGGVISITAGHARGGPDGGEQICISITDQGEGMDAETLDRANEPFFTTKEAGKGTGLGLSMVRAFAKQSGGRFCLKNGPGGGTVAELWLPAAIIHRRML